MPCWLSGLTVSCVRLGPRIRVTGTRRHARLKPLRRECTQNWVVIRLQLLVVWGQTLR